MSSEETGSSAFKTPRYEQIPGPRIGSPSERITDQKQAPSSITINADARPLPPEGVIDAVCVKIEDRGIVKTQWGDRHKISVVWQINALKQNGERFEVAKWFTPSMYGKSNLRKCLTSWRGRDLNADEEKQGFNTDVLIGLPCRLELVHVTSDDGHLYTSVQNVLPPSETSKFGVKEVSA